jgi:glycosyltransferase involved in cell wall biosynthesis
VNSIAVLIPALNCAPTIAGLVRDARRYVATVLVVDDGSTDATGELAAAAGAEVLRHDHNRGKAAALLSGMQALAARGCTHVVTMDGDGQHLADELPTLLNAAAHDSAALVIGARIIEPGMVAPIKAFGNRFANRWVAIACGQALPDTQSGFRLYPLHSVLALGCRAGHFGFETEVLIRAARARIPIRSVPVRTYYPPPAERVSHFRPFVDTVRIIGVVLKLILSRR